MKSVAVRLARLHTLCTHSLHPCVKVVHRTLRLMVVGGGAFGVTSWHSALRCFAVLILLRSSRLVSPSKTVLTMFRPL